MEAKILSDYLQSPYLIESPDDVSDYPGLGALTDWVSGTIQRDRGTVPQLTGQYLANGTNAKTIKNGLCIVVDMGSQEYEKKQIFRIIACPRTRDANAVIDITANHIWGDLSYMVMVPDAVASQANATPVQAFNLLIQNSADSDKSKKILAPYTAESDIPKVANVAWHGNELSNINDAILGKDQAGDNPTNTIEALYGAEIRFNNRHISFLKQAGRKIGIPIKYGSNLQTFSEDNTVDSTYNALVPYATYTPDEVPVDGDGYEQMDAQGTVQYGAAGGVEIYDSPKKGHSVVGHVQPGAYYKVLAKATENTSNGNTWYEIGPNQWIDETFWTYSKDGDYIVNAAKGHGTITIGDSSDNAGFKVRYNGAGTITYAGKGKVALWTSYQNGHPSGQYVANGANFKIYEKGYDQSGHVWYNLGNDATQWVDSQYLSLTKTNDYSTTPSRGYLRVKGSVNVTTLPGGRGSKPNWDGTKHQGRYQYTQVSQDSSGNNWYFIGYNHGNQIWVEAGDNVDFSTPGTVEYNQDQADIANAKATGKIPVYATPNGKSNTTTTVQAGQSFYIDQTSESGGKTWFHIPAGWVDSTFFNFSAAADVEPGDSDDTGSDSGEVEEQVVKLDPPMILAPGIQPYDAIRAQVQDFSNQNVRTQDQLRDVAEKWMKEYRFGQRTYSFTITYNQMQGRYSDLTTIDLYDYVPIQDDDLDIAAEAQCSSVVWDFLNHIIKSATIGSLPITYEHLLGQAQQQMTKTVGEAKKHSDHLFVRIHEALKLEKAAVNKIAQDLGMAQQAWKDDHDALEKRMQDIDSTATDVKNWIESEGYGVITASPDWRAPKELRAESANGGYMAFNGNGLEYVGDGITRSAIDSQGRVIAESITAGTVTGLTLQGVTVTGDSYLNSVHNGRAAVISADQGFSYTGNGADIAIGAKDLRIGSEYLTESDINKLHQLIWKYIK